MATPKYPFQDFAFSENDAMVNHSLTPSGQSWSFGTTSRRKRTNKIFKSTKSKESEDEFMRICNEIKNQQEQKFAKKLSSLVCYLCFICYFTMKQIT